MFFHQRATQAEYLDLPDRPIAEIVESYQSLASVNRLFIFAEPFQRLLPKMLGTDFCHSVSLLDLGAGDGSLGALLGKWARTTHGWQWQFTNLDCSLPGLLLSEGNRNVAGSVLSLPFRDASFDVVIASQMTHHLTGDRAVIQHLREAWRVARRAIFLTDLHRGPVLYCILWILLRVRNFPNHFRKDGLLSVRRGFRVGELDSLARQAGVQDPRASLYYGSRVILEAKKPSEGSSVNATG